MKPLTARLPRLEIEYPETDGKPIAENTLQFRWIVTIKGGLDHVFHHRRDVFVAGDLFWYPVEGHPEIVQAPDTLIAFGRPRGERRSYKQWEEGGVAPQVVFEVLSPSNRAPEMERKHDFYERHGVLEYYIYDPDTVKLQGFIRSEDGRFEEIPEMDGWTSPLLGIRFDLSGPELEIFGPDGRRFQSFEELALDRDQVERERDESERQREQAERQREQAERQRELAERQRDEIARDREQAERERDEFAQQLEAERRQKEQLAARLRELGIEPPF